VPVHCIKKRLYKEIGSLLATNQIALQLRNHEQDRWRKLLMEFLVVPKIFKYVNIFNSLAKIVSSREKRKSIPCGRVDTNAIEVCDRDCAK
jgi:hypothetical protein